MRHPIVAIWMVFALYTFDGLHASARLEQGVSRPRRPTAPLSDVLTHSELALCPARAVQRPRPPVVVRAASWNISAARYAPVEEIAADLKAMKADIAALQEVDYRLRRSGLTDQPGTLAAALGFHYVFAATIKWNGGDYGLAIVSRWPLVSIERHRLDVVGVGEPRIVLDVVICVEGRPLRVFNHHADVAGRSRRSGLARLTDIVRPRLGSGVLVAGDFNAAPDSPEVRAVLAAGLADIGAARNEMTIPNGRIDYLLADSAIATRVRHHQVWPTKKSDHHALIAEFRFE